MRSSAALVVESVDHVSNELAGEVFAFWRDNGVSFSEEQARARVSELVVLARDNSGALQAVATAAQGYEPELGDVLLHRFRYRVAAQWHDSDLARRLLMAFHAQAAADYSSDRRRPCGIAVSLPDLQLEGGQPWAKFDIEDVRFFLVSIRADDSRLRVTWFADARVNNAYDGPIDCDGVLPAGYRIDVLDKPLSGADADRAVALWLQMGLLSEADARERVAQVVVTASAPDGALCGLLTSFQAPVDPVRSNMHWVRMAVSPKHRQQSIPSLMTRGFTEKLQQRHDNGELQNSLGVFAVVQNEKMRKYRNDAVCPVAEMAFIGESPQGYQMRVAYLDGITTR